LCVTQEISPFIHVLHSSKLGSSTTGMGDFEVDARYTWAKVRSPFTHIAVALDAKIRPDKVPRRFAELLLKEKE
jgi:hypothetical protein